MSKRLIEPLTTPEIDGGDNWISTDGPRYNALYGRSWDWLKPYHYDGYIVGHNGDGPLYAAMDPRENSDSILDRRIDGHLIKDIISHDTVTGTPGDDRLYPGQGDDEVFGNDGNDTIVGGEGDDTLHGGDGDDQIRGDFANVPVYIFERERFNIKHFDLELPSQDPNITDGNDNVDAGPGNDSVWGFGGNDTIRGYTGDDKLYGHEGNDVLSAGEGGDELYGGEGHDVLMAGPRGEGKKDILVGGEGNDLFFLNFKELTPEELKENTDWWSDAMGPGAAGELTKSGIKAVGKGLINVLENQGPQFAKDFFATVPGVGTALGVGVDVLSEVGKESVKSAFSQGAVKTSSEHDAPDDLAIITDFNPITEAIILPLPKVLDGKHTSVTAQTVFFVNNSVATDADGNQIDIHGSALSSDGWGVQIGLGATGRVYAEIHLDPEALEPFDLKLKDAATEDFLKTLFDTSIIVGPNDTTHAGTGSIEDPNKVFPFSTDPHKYLDGIIPPEAQRFGLTTPDADTKTFVMGGGLGPKVQYAEDVTSTSGSGTVFMAGTAYGDLLSANGQKNNGKYIDLDSIGTTIFGSANAYMHGFDGDDVLFGGRGQDVLFGDDGNDHIYGFGGTSLTDREEFHGGNGHDTIYLGPLLTWSMADGGEGIDTADFTYQEDSVNVDLSKTPVASLHATNLGNAFSLNSSIIGSAASRFDLIDIEKVVGTHKDDTLQGGNYRVTLDGSLGNDSLIAGTASSVLFGGEGDDTLHGGHHDDIGSGGDGDDTLLGDSGRDQMAGGQGADHVNGGDDNDLLFGDAGAWYRVNVGGSSVTSTDAGPDWAADTRSDPNVFRFGEGGDNIFSGGFTYDASAVNGAPADLFNTDRFDPSGDVEMEWEFPVVTGSYVVTLYFAENYGGAGGILETGQRIFDVSVEGDVPSEFKDIDIYDLGNGYGTSALSYTAAVSDGSLSLEFLHNLDNPTVNAIEIVGADHGTGGDDVIMGGAGDDIIDGGAGNDTIDGGDGSDILSLRSATAGVNIALGASIADGHGGTDQVTNVEGLIGTLFDDHLTGDDADNILDGGAGDDVLTGGAGIDHFIGGAGYDIVAFADNGTTGVFIRPRRLP